MTGRAPRIFISAGEPSGDQHAAALVTAIARRFPRAQIEAFGGPAMAAAGARVRFPMEQYTAMGFLEVAAKLLPHLRLLHTLRQEFRRGSCDLVILVDYPGFNLRLAGAARAAGLPTLYYVAPQLWAWRPGRARRLAAVADRLAVVLPFEPGYFAALGLTATYVGHPLTERRWPGREEARRSLGVSPEARVLAVFPGSRRQEVDRLWPPFRDAAARLLAEGSCDRVLVAATPAGRYPDAGDCTLVPGDAARLLAAADAALVKSGTTTLEAAICGTPMVVAYRVHPISAAVARRVLRVPWVSLVNLVAGRAVVPELLQEQVTTSGLATALRPLLHRDGLEASAQRAALRDVREQLGEGGAAERVANLAAGLLPE